MRHMDRRTDEQTDERIAALLYVSYTMYGGGHNKRTRLLTGRIYFMGVAKGKSWGSWEDPQSNPTKIIKDKTCMHYACTARYADMN